MKKFMLLSYGFEKPTPEVMAAWGKWFKDIGDKITEQGGCGGNSREVTKDGSTEMPFGAESLTGYVVVQAEDMNAAEEIAKGCPIIQSLQIHELRSQ